MLAKTNTRIETRAGKRERERKETGDQTKTDEGRRCVFLSSRSLTHDTHHRKPSVLSKDKKNVIFTTNRMRGDEYGPYADRVNREK